MTGSDLPRDEAAIDALLARAIATSKAGVEAPKRSRRPMIAGAAAAVIVIGAGGIALATRGGTDVARPPATTVGDVGPGTGSSSVTVLVVSASTSVVASRSAELTAPAPADIATTVTLNTSATTVSSEPTTVPDTTVVSDTTLAPDATVGSVVEPTVAPLAVSAAPPTVPALLNGVLTESELPLNYSVFSNGTMYNFGTVGSVAEADSVTSKFEAVVPVDDGFVVVDGGPAPTGIVYVPSGVLFAPGSARVGAEFQQTLDLATAFMQFFPQVKMTIIGHTDADGDDAANLELSNRRAATAVNYMISKGVDAARLTPEGRGERDPVAANDTEDGKSANRRIEFVLTGLLDS